MKSILFIAVSSWLVDTGRIGKRCDPGELGFHVIEILKQLSELVGRRSSSFHRLGNTIVLGCLTRRCWLIEPSQAAVLGGTARSRLAADPAFPANRGAGVDSAGD